MEFSVGEKATVHNFQPHDSHLEGRECTVVRISDYVDGHIYRVEIQGVPVEQCWHAREIDLRKKYDGNELVSWDSCLWQPEETKIVSQYEKM